MLWGLAPEQGRLQWEATLSALTGDVMRPMPNLQAWTDGLMSLITVVELAHGRLPFQILIQTRYEKGPLVSMFTTYGAVPGRAGGLRAK